MQFNDYSLMTITVLWGMHDLQQKAKPTKLKKFLASKYAKPFYSDEEIAEIIKKVDDELIRIGNGSWKKGAAIVRKRVYKWV